MRFLRSLRVKRSLWSSSDAPNTAAQNCKNLICLCCEIVSIWGNIEARLLPVPLLSFMLANSLLPRSKQTALKKRDWILRPTYSDIGSGTHKPIFPKKNALFRQQFTYKLATVFAEHSRHLLHVMRNAAKHSLTMGPVNRFQNILPLKYF